MEKSGLINSMAWKLAEKFSAQLISTIVAIILARLLEPEHYGIISIVMVFIMLANVFVSSGLGSALIQKKDATTTDFFSILYFNIAFSLVLYTILFLLAPTITVFYGRGYEMLTPVLRILGLRIILTAINSVQHAYVSKKMMFKKLFVSTIWGTVISAIVGITMAYMGYGVWALVSQYLINTTVSTFTLTLTIKKRPRWIFSFSSVKELFPFGFRILSTGLLITGYQEVRALIIGKLYSTADLAYYDKGKQFPDLVVNNINSSLGEVLFPKMSLEQDDSEKIKKTTRTSIGISSFLMSPVILGLAAVAGPFVRLVLTEKWIDCIPLMRFFCIFYLFQPIHTANMQAIKAMGKSSIYLRLEIFKKSVELVVLLITMWISVKAMVLGMVICATLFTFVNAYPNIKLLNYGIVEQMSDILPNIIMAAVMFVCVYFIGLLPVNDFVLLCIQVISGALIYLALSIVTKNKQLKIIMDLVRKK